MPRKGRKSIINLNNVVKVQRLSPPDSRVAFSSQGNATIQQQHAKSVSGETHEDVFWGKRSYLHAVTFSGTKLMFEL